MTGNPFLDQIHAAYATPTLPQILGSIFGQLIRLWVVFLSFSVSLALGLKLYDWIR